MSGGEAGRDIVERALDRARRAGADAADALLVESDSMEARVRGDEIDFVKQARERTLGIRALVRGSDGTRSALTSTSDLSAAAVDRMLYQRVSRWRNSQSAYGVDSSVPNRNEAKLGIVVPEYVLTSILMVKENTVASGAKSGSPA